MILSVYNRALERASRLVDSTAPADGPPPRTFWPFVRWCLKGSLPVLIIATIISGLTGASEVATMWLLGQVVDAAAQGQTDWAEIWPLALAAVALLLILRPALFGISAMFQSVVIAPAVFTLTLSRLHRWTLGQAVPFFDNDFAGRISQKEMQTTRALTDIVIETVNAILFGIASVIGALVLAGSIHPRLMIVLAVWFAVYSLFLRYFLPRIRKRSAARASARAMVSGQVVDTITNIKTVKLFAQSEHEDQAALNSMRRLQDRQLEFGKVSAGFRLGLITLAGVLPIAMISVGIASRDAGVTPGDLAAIGAVSIRLAQMTGWVSFVLMGIYGNVGEVEDGIRTLAPPHTLVDAQDAKPMAVSDGDIEFDDLTFMYGRDLGGVANLSLQVSAGEKVGVVGASGAGKSTLVALLLRLYDAEAGRILIDGQNVGHVTQESLRAQIGMVTQETAMFNRSARDNIAYGRHDATDAEVIAAAKKAEAHTFIQELEDHKGRRGYEAFLGERGVKLSGGQRQRIALARAILKDAPILVLDEATSALDSEVEASIQSALSRVMEGKTVLAIAHRLSTLTEMDRIVVMDAGRIVEMGTHETLLSKGGLYANYWHRQSGGFIVTEAAE
ncbi:MAG: ABC transporter ATP-binding protein [Pseudomonadota bacterium]